MIRLMIAMFAVCCFATDGFAQIYKQTRFLKVEAMETKDDTLYWKVTFNEKPTPGEPDHVRGLLKALTIGYEWDGSESISVTDKTAVIGVKTKGNAKNAHRVQSLDYVLELGGYLVQYRVTYFDLPAKPEDTVGKPIGLVDAWMRGHKPDAKDGITLKIEVKDEMKGKALVTLKYYGGPYPAAK